MKYDVKLLEKLGQTQSIKQHDSVATMFEEVGTDAVAFNKLKAQNNDLVCMILPDDDDEE